jgi:hypothetical protein
MRLAILSLLTLPLAAATHKFDVVVYGGTAGGVIASVTAARAGLSAALLEPTGHLGGMVTSGLGFTDYGKKEAIGGYAREFYTRVGKHYGKPIEWLHEPHVAEDIFGDMLREAGVHVFEKTRLKESGGVAKQGARIRSIKTENGDTWTAAEFIDASYEGDLMVQAGVSWTYGRESSEQYGESLAGVRDKTPLHQFLVDVDPKDAQGKLLPEISGITLGPAGSADKAVQAYNFRMCFSEAPDRIAFEKPAGYDPARYQLLVRLIEARTKAEGKPPALGTLMKIDRLTGAVTDVNNNGAFSTDYIGGSWDYPNASYAKRTQIFEAHRLYTAGLFYFLANDPQVPAAVRDQMNQWGLCAHEFADSGHWPRQLYIREDRRMLGEYVMVQKDLQTELTKPDPIGMGSYNSDSHNVERIVGPDGFVRNEGDMQVAVKPYQIPYRILLPKRAEVTNLLVPVAFSASHVAYSSVRMEPQYMILGQAAGVAAEMAIRGKKAVQEIDTAALTAKLRGQGAAMEITGRPQ